jgi:hypothetical protein
MELKTQIIDVDSSGTEGLSKIITTYFYYS